MASMARWDFSDFWSPNSSGRIVGTTCQA
jgi:hypothetical protein